MRRIAVALAVLLGLSGGATPDSGEGGKPTLDKLLDRFAPKEEVESMEGAAEKIKTAISKSKEQLAQMMAANDDKALCAKEQAETQAKMKKQAAIVQKKMKALNVAKGTRQRLLEEKTAAIRRSPAPVAFRAAARRRPAAEEGEEARVKPGMDRIDRFNLRLSHRAEETRRILDESLRVGELLRGERENFEHADMADKADAEADAQVAEVDNQEKAQEDDFDDGAKISKGASPSKIDLIDAKIDEADKEILAAKVELKHETKKLKRLEGEREIIHKKCEEPPGMSIEERFRRRKNEIKFLKEGLEILRQKEEELMGNVHSSRRRGALYR
eukprot:gnl/TRDRNA2_/TRDRNA2_183126_c0_seq1.p1 gnl/TRDRNA2_/TRDRNA2_183126_c0~~gnl/TRDRNA2_/TRDRNA2_183126_c0_seq1.p1  ORF type:complete len:329 (+),score=97.29 gnl/TRDRNA2_/TRDRNA2_183126_c0_seq1:134-1120(+)